ncbi:MAG: hypothetical protein MUF64_10215 [Polyangiaceae bacterium]|nr:hypothetical protein [Polyangiaceae bacterium]
MFVVGGKNASNVLLGDIWSRTFTGAWAQWTPTLVGTSTRYFVGQVLAATFSYRDDCLYVLDIPSGSTQVRLVRVSTRQQVEVLGTWNRTATTRSWLTLDRDGGVLLSVARDSTAQTRVFRLDNPTPIGSGAPTVAGLMELTTAVTEPPLVDAGSYWFLGRKSSDRNPDVRRPTTLPLTPSSWAQVGASF